MLSLRSVSYASALLALSTTLAVDTLAAQAKPRAKPATKSANASVASPAPVVEIEAMDFAFKVPATAPAGLVTVRLKNTGKSLHHAQLARMNPGQTIADFMTQLRKQPGSINWREAEGGPTSAIGGQVLEMQMILAPGTYAVWCWIPSQDGSPHYMKGMYSKLEVTGVTTSKATVGKGDVKVTLSDYDYSLSSVPVVGIQTWRIENAGPQSHEVTLVKLNQGKTALDVVKWMEDGQNGEAPGRMVGGSSSIAPGRSVSSRMDLSPGEYALLCFTPEHLKGAGKPHADMGMMKTISVR